MSTYEEKLKEEKKYLEDTLQFVRKEIHKEKFVLKERRDLVLESRKEMWNNTVHFSTDFDRMTEINQYLSILENQASSYGSIFKQIKKYEKSLKAPYFGRCDFKEDSFDEKEKIYIGIHNIIDSRNFKIIVYDWRAPISSIFYEYEVGRATYKSPKGNVNGNLLLKRQFKINNGELEYFFDSSLKIDDEILQRVLSRNTSSKMRNIVETIQKEQNNIIRDTENEVLIVQGVAGSGKTSIALHRIAYLLYHRMNLKLNNNNIIIISPNEIFSKYILEVLPELGEENIEQITFRGLLIKFFKSRFKMESKNEMIERLITDSNNYIEDRKKAISFKGSKVFVKILDRFLKYYERNIIKFKDIYYDGKIIENKELLKNQFLNDEIGRPIAKRLKRIENIIFHRIHPIRKERIRKIEEVVESIGGHEFEIKSFSRLLSMKETKVLRDRILSFTKVDYYEVYKKLFNNKELFYRLSEGLILPENIEEIIDFTMEKLKSNYIQYEDCGPLLFLKLLIEGSEEFNNIKQVVIDEAQDYSAVEYEVFKLLFKNGRYTILGDINQSIYQTTNLSIYNEIDKILNKKKSIHMFLNKSYRSTYEISSFSQKILNNEQLNVSFERHERKPSIRYEKNRESMLKSIIDEIKDLIQLRYRAIGIICKTRGESRKVYNDINFADLPNIQLIDSEDKEIEDGVIVIPAYLAKGLEFDVVIVYNVNNKNYKTEIDRKLLYISCTRALHRLSIYYNGEKSKLIPSSTL